MRAIRWGGNDRYFGPFTYSAPYARGYNALAIILSSPNDEGRPCNLRISGVGHTLIIRLPTLIRPERRWVDTSRDEWSKGPGSGYWEIIKREYGFTYSEGHFSAALGRVTHDSSTEQRWGIFLPWTQWRHVRHSLYGLGGSRFATLANSARWNSPECATNDILQAACPTREFVFRDFDDEELTATTRIEEREWRFGTGWFRWLSLFRKAKIRRSLDIRFSGETGRRKGSWKGGTIGHGIDMQTGELHEAAFRRYCAEHGMTFVGPAPDAPSSATGSEAQRSTGTSKNPFPPLPVRRGSRWARS